MESFANLQPEEAEDTVELWIVRIVHTKIYGSSIATDEIMQLYGLLSGTDFYSDKYSASKLQPSNR